MKHRSHPLWKAFLLHRISGLALALFLPIHFVILGLALEGSLGTEYGTGLFRASIRQGS